VRRRAFTLVELLVVLGIVGLLAAFLLSHLGTSSRERARLEATRALIGRLDLALQEYRTELGSFPPDFTYLLTPRTITIVSGDSNDPRNQSSRVLGPMLVLDPERISVSGKDILDFWEAPLHYDPSRALGSVWSDSVNGQ
jgi:prepilin-type N-terminal cleavage/methylation domain-containing protein